MEAECEKRIEEFEEEKIELLEKLEEEEEVKIEWERDWL